jgi:hypothetical protein
VTTVLDLLSEAIAPTAIAALPPGTTEKFYGSCPALFEVYASVYEPYYVRRCDDEKIESVLNVFSLWLHGYSGVGKTAAIHRRMMLGGANAIHVYIGAAVDISEGHVALLREIYYSVAGKLGSQYKHLASVSQIVAEIAVLLSGAVKPGSVCLVIDEVPLIPSQPEEIGKFVVALHSILVLLKQITGGPVVRIIVTSIYDPQGYLSKGSERVFEQFKFVEFAPWTDLDIIALISLIENTFQLELSKAEQGAIVRASKGSPRFVKMFYKNYSVLAGQSPISLNGLLRETSVLLGYQSELYPEQEYDE